MDLPSVAVYPRTEAGWWLTAARGDTVEHYGRTGAEWEALEAAGWEFLVSQARLGRTTSYTEMNTVLARRTGVREFDFDLDGERHAMGELLGQLPQRSFGQARLLISVLVQYLNANDAGPGFYDLATHTASRRLRDRWTQTSSVWMSHPCSRLTSSIGSDALHSSTGAGKGWKR